MSDNTMDANKPFLVKHILNIEEDETVSESSAKDVDHVGSNPTSEDVPGLNNEKESQMHHRKIRRCFRAEQLEYLERCFLDAIYPDANRRKRIAEELKVSNDRVQVWFQNRRAKARKQWKQQHFTSLNRSSKSPGSISSENQLRKEYLMRFTPPSFRFEQLRREFHANRYEGTAAGPHQDFLGSQAQSATPMTICTCCPVPRPVAHFKPYEPRVTHLPPTSSEPPICRCLPLRSRLKCL